MTAHRSIARIALPLILVWSVRATVAWDVTVNGRPTSDRDRAASVAIDPATGSVFVGGQRQFSSTQVKLFVAKFTAAGTKEWQHELAGTGDRGTGEAALVAINAGGFLFVAGTLANTDAPSDIVVMKLDGRSARKRVLWTRIIDVRTSEDSVNAMKVTPDGGVVVAGVSSVAGNLDFYMMKFAEDGRDGWPAPQILSGTAPNGNDTANGLAILPGGDIAVTGWLTNATTGGDLVVGRFDGITGERRWLVTGNGPRSGGHDGGSDISVNPSGEIVVSGVVSESVSGSDFAVLKFSGAGALLWQKIVNRGFADGATSVAFAPSGDVIAGGSLEPATGLFNSLFFVVGLDPNGNQRWQHESSGTHYFLGAHAIAFNLDGNPVLTGMGENSSSLTTFSIVHLDKDTGAVIQDLSVAGTAPLVNEGRAIASDPLTNAMVAVGVTQNDRTSYDLTVVHYADGQEDWRRVITGRGKRVDRDDAVQAMAVDARRGAVMLAGYAQNTGAGVVGTPHEFRVAKIRRRGAVGWKYDFRDALPHLDNAALATTVNKRGDVFAAGRTCSLSLTSCFTVVRINTLGHEVWRTIVPGALPGRSEARAIIVDPQDGNVIAAGRLRTATGSALAVIKLDANTGTVLWTATANGISGIANAATMTSHGTVAVAGAIQGAFAVLEFSSDTGALTSSTIVPGFGEARSVAADHRDSTIVAAGAWGESRFGEPPLSFGMLAMKLDADGNAAWSANLGQMDGRGGAISVAVDDLTGDIAAAGTVMSPLQEAIFSVTLLDSQGIEQWRITDLPGRANVVGFAGGNVVAAGEFHDGANTALGVIAVSRDGTEVWRRTARGTADFGSQSASALAVDPRRGVFVGGTITNDPTGPDMFAAGWAMDGSDLPASRRQISD